MIKTYGMHIWFIHVFDDVMAAIAAMQLNHTASPFIRRAQICCCACSLHLCTIFVSFFFLYFLFCFAQLLRLTVAVCCICCCCSEATKKWININNKNEYVWNVKLHHTPHAFFCSLLCAHIVTACFVFFANFNIFLIIRNKKTQK